ncbi:LysR family transcriptional regulator [Azospirillum griseum]|uniref:LysR family transcriptional regulator n=1 Tax=Azospirillum griseum TaxID=2496639 RepID=A0A431VD85_9PROT|nr:LysR family transcriptional regulator [Azospirillum griseum]RTR17081.1 LysR family transcriptional regulator [Azospirillum griseum]
MNSVSWDDMHLLLRVAQAGGFSSAASDLRVDQSTISRRIARLEDTAGTALFRRTNRGVEPTPAARRLMVSAERMQEISRQFGERLNAGRDAPVTVDMAPDIAIDLIEPLLSRVPDGPMACVRRALPDLVLPTIHPMISGEGGEADLTLHWAVSGRAQAQRGDATSCRVARIPWAVCYADSFLERGGTMPQRWDTIPEQPLVLWTCGKRAGGCDYTEAFKPWRILVAHATERENASSLQSLIRKLRLGIGLGVLPTYAIAMNDDLRVLPVAQPVMSLDLCLSVTNTAWQKGTVRQAYTGLQQAFASFNCDYGVLPDLYGNLDDDGLRA